MRNDVWIRGAVRYRRANALAGANLFGRKAANFHTNALHLRCSTGCSAAISAGRSIARSLCDLLVDNSTGEVGLRGGFRKRVFWRL